MLTCHHGASQDVDGTIAHIAALLDKMSAKCFYRKEIYLLTYLSAKEKAEVRISVRDGRNVSVVFPVSSSKNSICTSTTLRGRIAASEFFLFRRQLIKVEQ